MKLLGEQTRAVDPGGRTSEVKGVLASIAAWAAQRDDIVGVALVGSWARGTPRPDSDVDVVVLTSDKWRYVARGGWIRSLLGSGVEIVRTGDWGPLTERRVRLHSGLEVEFGFASPSWAAIDPVDPGTARVVRDGCLPLFDEQGALQRLIEIMQ